MIGGQEYTLNWSLLGYDDDYKTYVAFFNCSGVAAGTCGDSYGSNFAASGKLSSVSVEPGSWTYNGQTAQRVNFSYPFIAPVVTETTDIVIRFYRKSADDDAAGMYSLSLLIPGSDSTVSYDDQGRRLLKQVAP